MPVCPPIPGPSPRLACPRRGASCGSAGLPDGFSLTPSSPRLRKNSSDWGQSPREVAEPPLPHPCSLTLCPGSRSVGGVWWEGRRWGPWTPSARPLWAQRDAGWATTFQGPTGGSRTSGGEPGPPRFPCPSAWTQGGCQRRPGGCSELPGLPAPALPRELCDLERVASSLFISASSFVKWKEGCWAALEVEALLPAGTLGRHCQSGGLLSPRWGDPETLVGLAGGLVCC